MRLRPLAIAGLILWACAPQRDVYLGSDGSLDASTRADASMIGTDVADVARVDAGAIDAASMPRDVQVVFPADAGVPAVQPPATPEPPVCSGGTADCDGQAGNGCEVDLFNDPKHCGHCGVACPSADCMCQEGHVVTVCPAGHADCDANPANGC